MSTETIIRVPAILPSPQDQCPNEDQGANGNDECPSPPLKSSKPLSFSAAITHPERKVQPNLPSTPTIPTLQMPIPLVALPSHTPSKPSTIPSLPILLNHNSSVGGASIRSSVRDLQSLAGSVGYSTLKPMGQGSLGESTIRPAPGWRPQGSLISFGGQLRNLDKEFIKQLVGNGSSMRGSESSSTVKIGEDGGRRMSGEGLKRGIDEVEVEWCFFCGVERLRGEMVLKEVDLGEMLSPKGVDGGGKEREKEQGQGQGEGKSWQWVCRGCD
ncbi:hypothetical protein I302_108625 [Kwoniella bestiolae CBS 10118]|uniref:Uncharacterized protein n=1 Tax=Kwoniella bestiolae CBS 10118 TaxID=1296100 RepID=A0A1B9FTN1_9TREE|nr:hypothetical protein I302_07762 [Kwoniella bestiolae CBS 10118]OCF22120.1 hypothetical protein I302_07762 [Kwoniella bestiolae CBS 10118]